MTRTELLNMLIALNRYHAYLEIGTQHADNNFNKIKAAIKVSVDPDPRAKAMHKCTSDAFFKDILNPPQLLMIQNDVTDEEKEAIRHKIIESYSGGKTAIPLQESTIKYNEVPQKFDLIFIDGLHHADQVEKDIINSMRVLEPGGTIVLHDCNPKEEWQQLVPRQHKEWYGDVWRAFVGFRLINQDVVSFCLDYDCGLGVINYTDKNIMPGFSTHMKWDEFDKNRKHLLGII